MSVKLAFPRSRRLAGRKNFARVFGMRCSAGDAAMVVYAAPNELRHPRVGLSVGRRLGNAVARNRIKRLIREAFRLEISRLPAGFDFVVVPRRGGEKPLDAYRTAWVDLSRRAAARVKRADGD